MSVAHEIPEYEEEYDSLDAQLEYILPKLHYMPPNMSFAAVKSLQHSRIPLHAKAVVIRTMDWLYAGKIDLDVAAEQVSPYLSSKQDALEMLGTATFVNAGQRAPR